MNSKLLKCIFFFFTLAKLEVVVFLILNNLMKFKLKLSED